MTLEFWKLITNSFFHWFTWFFIGSTDKSLWFHKKQAGGTMIHVAQKQWPRSVDHRHKMGPHFTVLWNLWDQVQYTILVSHPLCRHNIPFLQKARCSKPWHPIWFLKMFNNANIYYVLLKSLGLNLNHILWMIQNSDHIICFICLSERLSLIRVIETLGIGL